MVLAIVSLVGGLILLVWSADKFVDGACGVAKHFGMSPLLIGMVIVGFGTSAPEMVVSAFSAVEGNPGIALGNAYGSNITNIALILGLTALLKPITVQSTVLKKELPLLALVTILAAALVYDGDVTRLDAIIFLVVFAIIMTWTIYQGLHTKNDTLGEDFAEEDEKIAIPIKKAWFWLLVGLGVLVGSSRLVVSGAVTIATALGVSDLIIGLTIVAIGTSLPELASSLAAIKKGEHDIALGNVLGSNLFNTLAVVGIAGSISPMEVGPELFSRDIAIMGALTLSLFLFGFAFNKNRPGRINRVEGAFLLLVYIAYIGYLVYTSF